MKFYIKSKEASIRNEASIAEKALNDFLSYLKNNRIEPSEEEIQTIIATTNGAYDYIFGNIFENYIKAVYKSGYITDQKLNEEKLQFNRLYNFSGHMEMYMRYEKFRNIVDFVNHDGVYILDRKQLDTMIENSCHVTLSDKSEERLKFIKSYVGVLNDQWDAIYQGYITKDVSGKYICNEDKFVLENINK